MKERAVLPDSGGAGNSFCTDNASDFTGAWRKRRTAGYVLCAVWHNHGTWRAVFHVTDVIHAVLDDE